MSQSEKPPSANPQAASIASPDLEAASTSKSPSPPKSPFDDSQGPAAQDAGSSPSPANTVLPPPVDLTARPPQTLPSQPQNIPAPPGDPRVAELRAIFPDLDDTILLMVLESVNGDQERAIEALLGMSDPDYKPEPPVAAQAPAPTMTQEELDEQLARRLMIEEQEQQQARWFAQQQQRPRPQRQNSRLSEGHYQSPPPPPGGQGSDTMAEIQQSLTKAAEVGKKTLGDLFTKVKAKINEFEQGRQTSSQTQQQPQWAGGYGSQQHAGTEYAQYHASAPGAASSATASYYDPNPASPVISGQVSPPSRIPPPAVDGYDASPSVTVPVQAASPAHTTSGASRPSTSPAPIDGGKLGLLPKRPVSLVRDPQPAGPRRSLDSDDGLEYAENPFEDQKK